MAPKFMPSRYHLCLDTACLFIGSLYGFRLLILGIQAYPSNVLCFHLNFRLLLEVICSSDYFSTRAQHSKTPLLFRVKKANVTERDSIQKLKSYNESMSHFSLSVTVPSIRIGILFP